MEIQKNAYGMVPLFDGAGLQDRLYWRQLAASTVRFATTEPVAGKLKNSLNFITMQLVRILTIILAIFIKFSTWCYKHIPHTRINSIGVNWSENCLRVFGVPNTGDGLMDQKFSRLIHFNSSKSPIGGCDTSPFEPRMRDNHEISHSSHFHQSVNGHTMDEICEIPPCHGTGVVTLTNVPVELKGNWDRIASMAIGDCGVSDLSHKESIFHNKSL